MNAKLLLGLLLPTLVLASPGRFGPQGNGAGPAGCRVDRGCAGGTCPLNRVTTVAPTTLPASELISGLEEDRVAYDLYTTAFERWDLRVFDRIRDAETKHESAFVQLAASAGISLPARTPGVYATSTLPPLYAQLLARMNQSPAAALQAGALVEETDIADLRRMISTVKDDATRAVLAHLEQASARHLRAFLRNLARRGESYQPQVLTPAEFAVLATARG